MQKQKIEELLAGITDAQIAEYTPKPAPEMEGRGEVVVLMSLPQRLILFYVLHQMAVARQGEKLLEFVHTIFQRVLPTIRPFIKEFSKKHLSPNITPDWLAQISREARTTVASVTEELHATKGEQDVLDEYVQHMFAHELSRALAQHVTEHPGDFSLQQLRSIEYDVYMHNGQWVIAAERQAMSSFSVHDMGASQSDEIPEELMQQAKAQVVKMLLQQNPGSVQVTDASVVDLTSYPEDHREGVRARMAQDLADGNIILDLGAHREQHRFVSFEVQGQQMTQGLDPDVLSALLGRGHAQQGSSGGDGTHRGKPLAGWMMRPGGSH